MRFLREREGGDAPCHPSLAEPGGEPAEPLGEPADLLGEPADPLGLPAPLLPVGDPAELLSVAVGLGLGEEVVVVVGEGSKARGCLEQVEAAACHT